MLAVASCGSAVAQSKPAAKKEAKEPAQVQVKFKGTVDLVDTVQVASNVSSDGQAATVLFRNLEVSVGGVKGGPLVDTRTVSLVLPKLGSKDKVRVCQDVRGHVYVKSKGRAILMFQAAGQTTLIDLGKSLGKKTDLFKRIEGTIPANAPYVATFCLIVERDTDNPDVGAHVAIDSLDLTLGKPKPPK
jgi:hypothetical protein